MNKEYVTLETAKLLKKKGFNEWCEWVYEDQGITHSTIDADFAGHSNSNLESNQYAVPLQSQAQTWLRERHRVDVIVHIAVDFDSEYNEESFGGYSIWIIDHKGWICKRSNSQSIRKVFPLYEDALEIGLKTALDSI